jgi:hypothetical protein
MNQLNEIPTPASGYRVEEMDGELLLYHPQSTATVYMNQTAALVWQLCNGDRSVGQIISILEESFPDLDTEVRADVLVALKSFSQHGALKS